MLARTPLAAQAERRRGPLETGVYPARFGLSLARKDAELVAEAGRNAGVELRAAEAALEWLADAQRAGLGGRDYSAVLDEIVRAGDPIRAIAQTAAGPGPRETRAAAVAGRIRDLGGHRWVGLYDVSPEEVGLIAWDGAGAPAHPRFPPDRGLTGRAVAAAGVVVVNDVASDPDYLEAFGDTRSEVIVPIVAGGTVVGTIDVESDRTAAFGDAEISLLERCRDAARPLWAA